MMTIDTSKVDRLQLRKDIAAREAAFNELDAELERAMEPFDLRVGQIEADAKAAADQVRAEANSACAEIIAKRDAALAAMNEDYEAIASIVDDGNAERCCISGLVLLEGDKTVCDDDGREALVAVLPWPAAETDDSEADNDAAGAPDEAA